MYNKHLSWYEEINNNFIITSRAYFLHQAQIYDLQNQNCQYEYRFKRMSLAADLRILETQSSFYDGEPMPWKTDDKPTSSTTPSSLPPKGNWASGMGTPLGNCQACGSAPVSYHHHTPIFTVLFSLILLVIYWSSRIKVLVWSSFEFCFMILLCNRVRSYI